jgi:hypothetical protein
LLRFNIPAGHLTARSGPKDITAIAYAGAGLALAIFVFIHSFPAPFGSDRHNWSDDPDSAHGTHRKVWCW